MKTLAFSSVLVVLLVAGCEGGVNRQKRDQTGSSTGGSPPIPNLISAGKYY